MKKDFKQIPIGYFYMPNEIEDYPCDIDNYSNTIQAEGYNFTLSYLSKPSNNNLTELETNSWRLNELVVTTADYSNFYSIQCNKTIKFNKTSGNESDNNIWLKEKLLINKEFEWCNHLSLKYFLMPSLSAEKDLNLYGMTLNQLLAKANYTKIIVPVDLQVPNAWLIWNKLRYICNHNPSINLALIFPSDASIELTNFDQWIAEPLKLIIIPTTRFIPNKKGYPVLSPADQQSIANTLKLNLKYLISSSEYKKSHAMHTGDSSISSYSKYLRFLFSKSSSSVSFSKNYLLQENPEIDEFSEGYQDYLQSPLQPLMNHLESSTYQVFEKDPVKYSQYELAIYKALKDRISDEIVFIMVVGAGRGPLVDCSLRAAAQANRKVKVLAVEKNPNAFVTLQYKKSLEWQDRVELYFGDMRYFEPIELADILVSELLGSFGDNELSPECLDGIQRCLKPDGISIPCDYSSYLAPLSSTKLFNNIQYYQDESKFHSPYVVMFQSVFRLTDPQYVWKFEHPNFQVKNNSNLHNCRHTKLKFNIPLNGIVHGLAGYFEATLYKDVKLSINPSTHSPGMFSWFPLFFPIKNPLTVRKGEELNVNIWRYGEDKKVWYEWSLSSDNQFGPEFIHNSQGQHYYIGL